MMHKKGQLNLNKKIEAGAIIIIIIVILFSLYAVFVPEAQTAGDSLSDASKCVEAGCISNTSLTPFCQSNRSPQGFGGNSSGACPFSIQTIPLSSLFSGTGIVFLLIMVGLLLIILRTVLPKGKK